jgi:nickel/cobalt exporter
MPSTLLRLVLLLVLALGILPQEVPADSLAASSVPAASSLAPADGHGEGGAYAEARDRVKGLLQGPLTTFILLTSLGLALFIGALHALQPGHGKTLVAAYLVGSRGTLRHAVLLGAIVTFTHTFSVILLGVIVLFLSDRMLPETVNLWLGIASGALVAVMGAVMLVVAYRRLHHHAHGLPGTHGHGHFHLFGGHDHPVHHGHGHSHDHAHGHDHPNDHGHDHPEHGHGHSHTTATPARPRIKLASKAPGGVSLWSLFTLGIAGGIVPCLDAIVLLLIAVGINRVALGLIIILAFSLGIASVLIAVGILMVKAKGLLDRFQGGSAWLARLPVVSAFLITLIGIAMLFQTLAEAGVMKAGH